MDNIDSTALRNACRHVINAVSTVNISVHAEEANVWPSCVAVNESFVASSNIESTQMVIEKVTFD